MGIRVVQLARAPPLPLCPMPDTDKPHATVDKPFLLSDGKVQLEASLDKSVYNHGDTILVNVIIHNNSSKTVRRIKV